MKTIVRPRPLPQPRPPWEWRDVWQSGKVPRTCLTNHHDPVSISRGGTKLPTGKFDWALRLYQHHGATVQSTIQVVDGERCVMYSQEEWAMLRERECCWLEYLQPDRGCVLRLGFRAATVVAQRVETRYGIAWAVPLHHYTTTSWE